MIEYNSFLRNTFLMPTQKSVWNLPDEIVGIETVLNAQAPVISVETSLQQFAGYEQQRYGFGPGFREAIGLGGSPSVKQARETTFSSPNRTFSHADLPSSLYTLALLPPQYVSLKPEIYDTINALPHFDNTSRRLWHQIFDKFGTHVVTRVVMGGAESLESTIDTTACCTDPATVAQQVGYAFTSTFDPDATQRAGAAAKIDASFKAATKSNSLFRGGNPPQEAFQRDQWLQSVPTNPAWLRLGLRSLSDFFPEAAQVRKDIDIAMDDYLYSKLIIPQQELVLGPQLDAALLSRGASINVSSVRTECTGRCWAKGLTRDQCVDSNCDHPCCDTSKSCTDPVIRQCVCEIDAFCCTDWDQSCEQRVTSAGCVNCNCIRRKWDVEANGGAGKCEVLVASQQYCEDPWRGQGEWEVICIKYENYNDVLTPGNQERFIFNAADPAQTAIVNLGKDYFCKRVHVEVSPPPDSERCVSQVVVTDDRTHIWGSWGPQGTPVARVNEATEPWCLEANTFKFEFGPANSLVGSMIYSIRVFSIEDSRPAGLIEDISRFEITGFAFDPVAPLRKLNVEVYVDGKLLKTGQTGVQRADMVSAFSLPAGAAPGFKIPIALSGLPKRVVTVHIEWIGVFQKYRSESLTYWTMQNAGSILEAFPSFVRGWAYLVDVPAASYQVEVLANGEVVGTGKTGDVESPADIVYTSQTPAGTKLGFNIPVRLNRAASYTITARVRVSDSQAFDFNDPVTLDMRHPIGRIISSSPADVQGWAFDPANPSETMEIHTFVDDVLVARDFTNVTLSDLNSRYLLTGSHGFNHRIRTQGGRLHLVSVYMKVGQSLKFLDSRHIAIPLQDQASTKILTTDGLNFLGVGYNPCYNEWRLRVVDFSFSGSNRLNLDDWKSSSLFDLELPDEMSVAKLPSESSPLSVFHNMSEWGQYQSKSWPFAAGHSLLGGGASYSASILEPKFTTASFHLGWAELISGLISVSFNSSSALKTSSYFNSQVSALREYNLVNRPLYFRLFDLFGTSVASSFSLGGKIEMESQFKLSDPAPADFSGQMSALLTVLTTPPSSPEHQNALQRLDPAVLQGNNLVRFVGGNAGSFDHSEAAEWKKTIANNLAVVNVGLRSLWELVADAQRRDWIQQAALDYVRLCTPPHWQCHFDNVALRTRGTRVTGVSSRVLGEPDDAVFNLIRDDKVAWRPNGEIGFIFGDNDPNQYIIVELPKPTLILRIAVEIDAYPSEQGVWDFVRVEYKPDDPTPFRTWAIVGDQNDKVDVVKTYYEFTKPKSEPVKFVRFLFGSGRPEFKKGSRIRQLYIYSCKDL